MSVLSKELVQEIIEENVWKYLAIIEIGRLHTQNFI